MRFPLRILLLSCLAGETANLLCGFGNLSTLTCSSPLRQLGIRTIHRIRATGMPSPQQFPVVLFSPLSAACFGHSGENTKYGNHRLTKDPLLLQCLSFMLTYSCTAGVLLPVK
jgi:hypothetical protein